MFSYKIFRVCSLIQEDCTSEEHIFEKKTAFFKFIQHNFESMTNPGLSSQRISALITSDSEIISAEKSNFSEQQNQRGTALIQR